jgi:CubicO group peptidase (beta-lactamase class C family)
MSHSLSRRTLLRATAATAGSTFALGQVTPGLAAPDASTRTGDGPFRALDEKIRAGMRKYAIPGVALGVLYRGREYVRGYGVTNVDYPVAVDGDTVFRVASNTKTFTGTTVMRLVEQGRLDLDATVRSYLPDLRTSDPSVADTVTLRQLLNHTAGWWGDYFADTGQGDDALARYVAKLVDDPQLTPVGEVFSYNNAALAVAGRVIEVVTGTPYEQAVRDLLVDPLGLAHSRFFTDEIVGFNVAAAHNVVDGRAVVEPSFYHLPRAVNPAGGLISSARDMLRYARFHLGDGTVPDDGTPLLTARSLRAMRSHPGPGGTLLVELDGMGVTWMLRPTAEGIRVVQHGGDLAGQHSGFLMVPDRGFVLVMLTNSEGGPELLTEFFADDWALRRYAGVSNLPAVPQTLTPSELAPYEGRYIYLYSNLDGSSGELELTIVGKNGQLAVEAENTVLFRLAFYRRDYVLQLDADGTSTSTRADFVRGADGQVAWLRTGGRLVRHALTHLGLRTSGTTPAATGTPARAALLRRL